MKKIVSVAVVAIALAGAYVYASPYITLHQMKAAVESQDADALSAHINFPELRESYKALFMAQVGELLTSEGTENDPFSRAGAAMGVAMMTAMADNIISPEGVKLALHSGQVGGFQGFGHAGAQSITSEKAQDRSFDLDYTLSYRNWNTVTVTIQSPAGQNSTVLFSRNGLTNWKLSGLELPSK